MLRGSLKMLEFQEGAFLRPLAIIYKRGRELSPAVRKFIEVLTTSNIVPHAVGATAATLATSPSALLAEDPQIATATPSRRPRRPHNGNRFLKKDGRVSTTRPFLFSVHVLQRIAMTPEAETLLDSIASSRRRSAHAARRSTPAAAFRSTCSRNSPPPDASGCSCRRVMATSTSISRQHGDRRDTRHHRRLTPDGS